MVKRSENVNVGGLWLEGHGLSLEPGLLSLSSRVCRAAPSPQMQSHEPVVASSGLAKTATLTHDGHNVAKDAARRDVEAEAERRRDERRPVGDLEDRLEADALAADLARAGGLARLAHLAHGVEVLGLEAALVMEGDKLVGAAFNVQPAQLTAVTTAETVVVVEGAVVGVLDELVQDPRRRRVDLARERAWMVKRSEIVNLGRLWVEGHGLSEVSEMLGLS